MDQERRIPRWVMVLGFIALGAVVLLTDLVLKWVLGR